MIVAGYQISIGVPNLQQNRNPTNLGSRQSLYLPVFDAWQPGRRSRRHTRSIRTTALADDTYHPAQLIIYEHLGDRTRCGMPRCHYRQIYISIRRRLSNDHSHRRRNPPIRHLRSSSTGYRLHRIVLSFDRILSGNVHRLPCEAPELIIRVRSRTTRQLFRSHHSPIYVTNILDFEQQVIRRRMKGDALRAPFRVEAPLQAAAVSELGKDRKPADRMKSRSGHYSGQSGRSVDPASRIRVEWFSNRWSRCGTRQVAEHIDQRSIRTKP